MVNGRTSRYSWEGGLSAHFSGYLGYLIFKTQAFRTYYKFDFFIVKISNPLHYR